MTQGLRLAERVRRLSTSSFTSNVHPQCYETSAPCPAWLQSTLLGLLGACNFELSILQCANRVMGSDGARILASGYQQCSRPTEA